MRTPFDFGGSVDAVHFVNREAELEMLTRNFHAARRRRPTFWTKQLETWSMSSRLKRI